jgi:O-antigen/teichoic acid export membrane protein
VHSSTRIALNTAASYTRSILTVGLALFSSRWILQALGATDFGLFNVVGSLIVFLSFFNSVMASSAARHFAYALGKGDPDDVNQWFNTSLSIHLILPAILILVGWPIAEYVIRNVLTIPPTRSAACILVFRISLIASFVNMASIPFVAMFTAKQRISELAVWDALQSVLVFVLAWGLTRIPMDRLLFYATGMVAIHVLIHIAKVARGFYLFSECRPHFSRWFKAAHVRELLGFAVWNVIGSSGSTLRDQGSAMLLNVYFGSILNSAFGIAKQVSTQANQLSSAMQMAFIPEITAREGRGERGQMLSLAHRASKFGTLIAILFSIPLIVEMDYVLHLWLRTPPEHTTIFCQLILCTFMIDRLTNGYMMAVNACGKIAAYQATVGGVLVLTLPLAWLFLRLGYPPASIGIAFIITAVICCLGRVLWLRRLFGEPVRHWVFTVFAPCLSVAAAAYVMALAPQMIMPVSFARLALASTLACITTVVTAWRFVLDADEQRFGRQVGKHCLGKLVALAT